MSKVRMVAKSARLRQSRSSQKEVPHILGQGRRLGGATPCPRPGAVAERRATQCPRAVAVRAQKGLKELLHDQGQEGWW